MSSPTQLPFAAVESSTKMATLNELLAKEIPEAIFPVPSRETLRRWFRSVPQMKTKRGGPVRYSVPGVENFFLTFQGGAK